MFKEALGYMSLEFKTGNIKLGIIVKWLFLRITNKFN